MSSNYDNIPIDIHYNKLLDWLISRRHATADWHKSLLVVRSRKAKALSSGTSDLKGISTVAELADIEVASLSYFDSLSIMDALRKHDSYNGTNVLRQYTHPLTKAWQEVVDVYTKDGVHLAEAAQLILRNVTYEVPALRKQIVKIEQDQQECIRKQNDCQRQAKLCSEKYAATCNQLGIEGRNPRAELLHLASDLSNDLGQIEKQISKLALASVFYGSFVKFLRKTSDLPSSFLPLLQYVTSHGNTTVYEWRTGCKPDVVLSPMAIAAQLQQAEATEQLGGDNRDSADIDWGDLGTGITVVDNSEFEVINVDPETAVEVIVEGSGEDGEGGRKSKSPDDPIEVKFGDEKKVAQGEDAVTIFEGLNTRTKLLDDLAELESFLAQRLEEMKLAEAGSMAYVETVAMDCAPKSVLEVSSASIAEYLKLATEITCQLTSERLTHLFKIRSSEAYLGKLVNDLEKIASNGEKAKQLTKLLGTRYQELGESVPDLTRQIAFLARRTMSLKTAVEKQLSAKYNNRIVNLIGEVCQLASVAN